jgi:hypothetical protein
VKPAAPGRIGRRVRSDLLHDDVYLGQLRLVETEAARIIMHCAPRRADLRLVAYLYGADFAQR